jgi:hypothetical protein
LPQISQIRHKLVVKISQVGDEGQEPQAVLATMGSDAGAIIIERVRSDLAMVITLSSVSPR